MIIKICTEYLLCARHMLGVLPALIYSLYLWDINYYYPSLADKETETQ